MVALRSKSWPCMAAHAWLMGLFGVQAYSAMTNAVLPRPAYAPLRSSSTWTTLARRVKDDPDTFTSRGCRNTPDFGSIDYIRKKTDDRIRAAVHIHGQTLIPHRLPGTSGGSNALRYRRWFPGRDNGQAGTAFLHRRRCPDETWRMSGWPR